jgi:SAM-dependent methyltransferase
MTDDKQYIPALRYRFLTPLYDPLLRWVMRELAFKRRLIEQAHIMPGFRVLDLGCGTGTLTVLIKQMHPHAEITGIDGDQTVLGIAHTKAAQGGTEIQFDWGMAYQLPYPDNSFDRVLSSLVIHHLTTDEKQRAFQETFRILKPGGELLVIDFGKPHNVLAWVISIAIRRLERAEDNVKGLLPEMLRRAGFQDVQIVDQFMNFFGTIALYRGRKS